jgi:hypothetical protein
MKNFVMGIIGIALLSGNQAQSRLSTREKVFEMRFYKYSNALARPKRARLSHEGRRQRVVTKIRLNQRILELVREEKRGNQTFCHP